MKSIRGNNHMFKNIMNNTQSGVGKSIYNIESNGPATSATNSDLADFINSLAPVTINQTTTTNQSGSFGNLTADTITTNILTVLENFYVGSDQLFQISLSDVSFTNGASRQDTIITTNNYQSSNLTYTSIILNVPYLYPTPDYVPNSTLHEAPDNYLEVYDSKFRVSGPFTEIKSMKTAMISPIFTVGYLDRVEFSTLGSSTSLPTAYDKGIAFEYVNSGNISFGFYGYSTQYDRFVFYKSAVNNGTTTYQIYKNGLNTGQTGIHTDYNVTRPDKTSLTSVEADVLYSHIINSSDQIYTSLASSTLDRSLTINSYGLLSIVVNQDTNFTPGTFDFNISVKENIIESSSAFNGTYSGDYTILCQNAHFGVVGTHLTTFNVNSSAINLTSYGSSSTSIDITTNNSSGGINISSGTGGLTETTTGDVSITSGTAKSITIIAGSNGLTEISSGLVSIQSTSSNISLSTGSSGSITLTSGTGGITETTTGDVSITSGTTNSINMTAGTSGITETTTGNISLTSGTTNSINMTAGTGGITETTTGDVSITSGTAKSITITAGSNGLTEISSGLVSIQSTLSNIALSTGSSGSITLTSGTGGITETTTGDVSITSGTAKSITITAGSNGLTETTTGDISITSGTAKSITITAGSNGLTETTTGDVSITSGTTKSITITAGSNGLTEVSTGDININTTGTGKKTSINTLNVGNEVDIGNTSIIKLNNYAQITNYASLGTSSRNLNTIFEISTNLTSTGSSSAILVTPTITGYNNNSTQSFQSTPTIITQSNSTVPLITNMSLYPVNLTVGSFGTVTNSSTLYIDGTTSTGQSNYSIYSKIGNIFFGGSTGNVMWNSTTNTLGLTEAIVEVTQSIGNTNPYLSIVNSSQQLNYYILSATNIIGSGELYLDGTTTHITMTTNYIYNGIGVISAVQSDGTSCQFQISFSIVVIGGVSTIKSSNINMNYNDVNNFSYNLSTDASNNIIFNVKSLNSSQTNWGGNVSITVMQL